MAVDFLEKGRGTISGRQIMKKIDWKDVGKRVVKTFIQAGINMACLLMESRATKAKQK